MWILEEKHDSYSLRLSSLFLHNDSVDLPTQERWTSWPRGENMDLSMEKPAVNGVREITPTRSDATTEKRNWLPHWLNEYSSSDTRKLVPSTKLRRKSTEAWHTVIGSRPACLVHQQWPLRIGKVKLFQNLTTLSSQSSVEPWSFKTGLTQNGDRGKPKVGDLAF